MASSEPNCTLRSQAAPSLISFSMSEYASGDDGDDSIDDEEGVVEEMIND
uniref:Uncharacterized protein n=1 Tax=Physcomitrium patens TaxID=3218 RepID=A0A2K1IS26_PHYPA|nr:hypothetical protein PHYPA_026197 [Physcomitrium patens]